MTRLLITTFIVFVLVSACSCCRRVVTVVERHDSTIFQSRIDTLKLLQRDSVIMMMRGDTFVIENWKIRERERVQIVQDTIRLNTEKPVTVEVEKPVTPKWAWWLLIADIVAVLVFVLTIIIKVK